MSATNLRQLSRDYAQGKITVDEYRSQRASLLNGLVDGTVPLKPFEPPAPAAAPVSEPDAGSPRDGESTLRIAQTSGAMKWVATAAVVLIVGGAAGYFMMGRKPAPAPTVSASPPAAQAVSAAAGAIQAFLEKKDWQPESLDRFFSDWVKLDLNQRKKASDTPLYKHFSDEAYAQLVEEQTLVDLGGDPDAVKRQKHLLQFAADMEFQDPRFKEFALTHKPAPPPASEPPATPSPGETAKAAEPMVAAAEPAAKPTPATVPPETTTTEPPQAEPAKPTPPVAAESASTKPESEPAKAEEPVKAPAAVPAATTQGTPPAEETAHATTAVPATTAAAVSAPPKQTTVAETETAPSPPPAAAQPAPAPAATKPKEAPSTATAKSKAPATTRRPGTLECRAALAKERRPYCRDGLEGGGLAPLMVVLPGGDFTMGGDAPNAGPAHKVTLAHSFAMALQEISVEEYSIFCKATGRAFPSQPWSGTDYPVVNVSWDDAVAYANWLSKATGHRYRLPTEAEWEYSARAGSTGRYPSGDELLPTDARFSYQRLQDSPLPRSDRTINRNRFRLYNMLGNVREWVLDGWHDNYQGAPGDGSAWTGGSGHVVRGGSYRDGADKVQSASREQGPSGGDRYTGFRVVQEIPSSPASGSTVGTNSVKWLAERGENQYTLQLFAVKNIASVEKIIARHPRLEIMILPSDDRRQPYHVYYGIFDTRAEAKEAFAKLPKDILSQVRKPLLRSFAQISQSLVQR